MLDITLCIHTLLVTMETDYCVGYTQNKNFIKGEHQIFEKQIIKPLLSLDFYSEVLCNSYVQFCTFTHDLFVLKRYQELIVVEELLYYY